MSPGIAAGWVPHPARIPKIMPVRAEGRRPATYGAGRRLVALSRGLVCLLALPLLAAGLGACGSGGPALADGAGDAPSDTLIADGTHPGDGHASDGGAGDGPAAQDGPPADGATGDAGPGWYVPPPGTTWQWQLDGTIDTTIQAEVFDIDLFDTAASVVAALHGKGAKVFCYMSAGSWEDWRPDKDDFPPAVLGKDYEGWPGEKWLDIRRIDLLGPIMGARLDLCQAKGFDGVEPDNIDGYTNDTGFPLTAQDQIAYNTWLAEQAHARGLSIGLKNDSEQVAALLPLFDWALTEDCFDQGWCEDLAPFVAQGKAVFMAEYTDTGVNWASACAKAGQLGFSAILKHRNLDAWRQVCP